MNKILKILMILVAAVTAVMDLHAVTFPDASQFDDARDGYLILTCERLERGDIDSIDLDKLDAVVSVYKEWGTAEDLMTALCIEGFAASEKGDSALAAKTMSKTAVAWFEMNKDIVFWFNFRKMTGVALLVLLALCIVGLVILLLRSRRHDKSIEEHKQEISDSQAKADGIVENSIGSVADACVAGNFEWDNVKRAASCILKDLEIEGMNEEYKGLLLTMCSDAGCSINQLMDMTGIKKTRLNENKNEIYRMLGMRESEKGNAKEIRKRVIELMSRR